MSRRSRKKICTGDDPLLELPDFRIGKNGIEKAYDIDLRGTAGTSQVEVNAYGRVVRELAREDGMAGQEVVLAIDMALQDLGGATLRRREQRGSVVMDAVDRRGAGAGLDARLRPSALRRRLSPSAMADARRPIR